MSFVPLFPQAIADTSGLKTFAEIGRLDLLAVTFTQLWAPPGVQREILVNSSAANILLMEALMRGQMLSPIELSEGAPALIGRYSMTLGVGESEVIGLGVTARLPVLMDDLAARQLAKNEGVKVVGSLRVLDYCKQIGVVSQVRPIAEAMRLAGRFFSAALLQEFYRSMGEE